MEKMETAHDSGHNLVIKERKNSTFTGINKIISFDDEEFLVDTTLGFMLIKGENLEILKLESFQGNLALKGKINSLEYIEDQKAAGEKSSFVSKLFK